MSWSFMTSSHQPLGFTTSNHQPHINSLELSLVQHQALEHQVVNPPLHHFYTAHLLGSPISHSVVSSKSSKPPAPRNPFPRCSEEQSLKVEGEEAQPYTAEHVQLLHRKGKKLPMTQQDFSQSHYSYIMEYLHLGSLHVCIVLSLNCLSFGIFTIFHLYHMHKMQLLSDQKFKNQAGSPFETLYKKIAARNNNNQRLWKKWKH